MKPKRIYSQAALAFILVAVLNQCKEDYLLTETLEPTTEGYTLAKIMGLKLAKYYQEQHGMLTVCPMPYNIYDTNEHFDLERS